MDRIIINCKSCGRPLAAIPGTKSRKCAACGATTKIPLVLQQKPVTITDAIAATTSRAKPPEEPGKTAVIKQRTITNAEGDEC